MKILLKKRGGGLKFHFYMNEPKYESMNWILCHRKKPKNSQKMPPEPTRHIQYSNKI